MRTLLVSDAPEVHALLCAVFDDEPKNFDAWWAARSGDAEYDPSLCFLAFDGAGTLAGLAWCWKDAFLKDLAVSSAARRKGLAEALCRHVFAAFRERGAAHVDLKTNLVLNADAVRLYRRLGMYEVGWAG